jgi:ribonuclease HII
VINSSELIAQIKAASGEELERLASRYASDPRRQVQAALSRALGKAGREAAEQARIDGLYRRLDEAQDGVVMVGADEVGRGALAGPLMVAAVALPARPRLAGLDDSKRLTPLQRERLAVQVGELALGVALARVEAHEIDQIGMAASLYRAFLEAISSLDLDPDLVLLDGRPLGVHPRELAIVGGDAAEAPIAAASVVAKVARDAWMVEADIMHPGYGLAANKGYGSAAHIAAIQDNGPSSIHRMSFCRSILSTQGRLF